MNQLRALAHPPSPLCRSARRCPFAFRSLAVGIFAIPGPLYATDRFDSATASGGRFSSPSRWQTSAHAERERDRRTQFSPTIYINFPCKRLSPVSTSGPSGYHSEHTHTHTPVERHRAVMSMIIGLIVIRMS